MTIMMNRMLIPAIVLPLLIAGCSHAKNAEGRGGESRVEYYAGRQDVSLPTGRTIRSSSILISRRFEPGRNTIEEEAYDINTEDSTWAHYVVVLTVSGNTFRLRETTGQFDGEGTLQGEPWKWTSWKSTSRASRGNMIESTDRVEGDTLTAVKLVKTSDGQLVVKVAETLLRITQDEFERRKKELIVPGKEVR